MAPVIHRITVPLLRTLLDRLRRKGHDGGVLGVRAHPSWDGPAEFRHEDSAVTVVPCASALAVREELVGHSAGGWLVVLTDRDEDDLGLGITARFVGNRLHQPDPWEAVQERFAAGRIDQALVNAPDARQVATGLLALTGGERWEPARGGLLTRDHALGAVASHALGVDVADGATHARAVLRWSCDPEAGERLVELRSRGGGALADQVLAWLAEHAGRTGEAIAPLLRSGRLDDVVPLGAVGRVVVDAEHADVPWALLRRELDARPTRAAVRAWAQDAEETVRHLLVGDDTDRDAATRVLGRAESRLGSLEAGASAELSDVLHSGLSQRLAALGDRLQTAAVAAKQAAESGDPDLALVEPETLTEVEQALERVRAHVLVEQPREHRVHRARAAVRVLRWLALPAHAAGGGLAGLTRRYRDSEAWVDRAVADIWPGVSDETLASGLHAVLEAVRSRRDAHDRAFARAVAAEGTVAAGRPGPSGATAGRAPGPSEVEDVLFIEDVLPRHVLPLAKITPTLLIVADGMSLPVATELIDDIRRDYGGWEECLPDRARNRDGASRRITAVAALPSVTRTSRASLLAGELTVGEKDEEQRGFERACTTAAISGQLFHKALLDGSRGGEELASSVSAALRDTAGTALVCCVLNTVDDALDKSDMDGTTWTADRLKHLEPLLRAARDAGRTVVLTADHGHVVERREGRVIPASGVDSNRSRPGGSDPGDRGEVRVRGPRVLHHDGDAILAVDDRLRYGRIKAGYHGGASPAELVVGVCVLTSGEPPKRWSWAPPQAPDWWRGRVSPRPGRAGQDPRTGQLERTGAGDGTRNITESPSATRRRHSGPAADAQQGALFDTPVADASAGSSGDMPGSSGVSEGGATATEASVPNAAQPLADAVLGSTTYKQQRKRAQRSPLTDEQVHSLLAALLAAADFRLDADSAAAALGFATARLDGALPHVQRLLNVEQYPVLTRDPDGSTLVLDEALLREQFEVSSSP